MEEPPPHGPEDEAITAAFYQAYGHAIAFWAHLESMQCLLFRQVTGMTKEVSRRVFYSAKSYSARADMFDAAVAAAALSLETNLLLKAISKKARTYSGFRNHIVHGDPVFLTTRTGFSTFNREMFLSAPKHKLSADETPRTTKKHLENARLNFGAITYCTLYAALRHDHPMGEEALSLCRARVLELPNLPENEPVNLSVELPVLPGEQTPDGWMSVDL